MVIHNIKPKTNSDCEVIIHLYNIFGTDFVNLLDGVFAFILFDQNNGNIMVARSYRVRPLFYQRQLNNIIRIRSKSNH